MIKSIKWTLTCLGLVIAVSQNASAVTLGGGASSTQEFLECENLKWYEQAACDYLRDEVNGLLGDAPISISAGNLIAHIQPLQAQGKLYGNTCDHQTNLRGNWANITLRSSANLDLRGNSISSPLVLGADLPVDLYTKIKLKDIWGCGAFSDKYNAQAWFGTQANTMMTFSLEPKHRINEQGDYEIMIAPVFDMQLLFENIYFDYEFANKNPLNGLLTIMATFPSHTWNLLTTGLESGLDSAVNFKLEGTDELTGALTDLGIDLGIGFAQQFETTLDKDPTGLTKDLFIEILTAYFLEQRLNCQANYEGLLRPVFDTSFDYINGQVDPTLMANGVPTCVAETANIAEQEVHRQLQSILGLNEEGRRTFVIPKNVVNGPLVSGAIIPATSQLLF